MANYGVRASLGPDYESKYHMRAQGANPTIGVNSEAMDYQMPYRATFLNGLPESKEEYTSAYAHGMNSNDDDASNARYQELAERESDLKEKILNLEAEIQWQEKLRDNEMSGDPMWEVAKHKFIYDNDASALENIMSRKAQAEQLKSSQEIQREQIKASKEEELASKDAAARSGRDYLTWTFKNYKANPDDLQALDNLFSAKKKLEELAQAAGKNPEDYYNDTTLEEIDMALEAGLVKKKENVETAKKNAAIIKAKKSEDDAVNNIIEEWNSISHDPHSTKNKKKSLANEHPNHIFTVEKGKIVAKRKAGK